MAKTQVPKSAFPNWQSLQANAQTIKATDMEILQENLRLNLNKIGQETDDLRSGETQSGNAQTLNGATLHLSTDGLIELEGNLTDGKVPTNKSVKDQITDDIRGITSNITPKEAVDTKGDLPLTGNSKSDLRLVIDEGAQYLWSITAPDGILDDWLLYSTTEAVPSATDLVEGIVKIGNNIDFDNPTGFETTISIKDASTTDKGVVQLSGDKEDESLAKAPTSKLASEINDTAEAGLALAAVADGKANANAIKIGQVDSDLQTTKGRVAANEGDITQLQSDKEDVTNKTTNINNPASASYPTTPTVKTELDKKLEGITNNGQGSFTGIKAGDNVILSADGDNIRIDVIPGAVGGDKVSVQIEDDTTPRATPTVATKVVFNQVNIPSNDISYIELDGNGDAILKQAQDHTIGYDCLYENTNGAASQEVILDVYANGILIPDLQQMVEVQESPPGNNNNSFNDLKIRILLRQDLVEAVTTFPATITIFENTDNTGCLTNQFKIDYITGDQTQDINNIMLKSVYDNTEIDVSGNRVASTGGDNRVDFTDFEWFGTINLSSKVTTEDAIKQLDIIIGDVSTLNTVADNIVEAINENNTLALDNEANIEAHDKRISEVEFFNIATQLVNPEVFTLDLGNISNAIQRFIVVKYPDIGTNASRTFLTTDTTEGNAIEVLDRTDNSIETNQLFGKYVLHYSDGANYRILLTSDSSKQLEDELNKKLNQEDFLIVNANDYNKGESGTSSILFRGNDGEFYEAPLDEEFVDATTREIKNNIIQNIAKSSSILIDFQLDDTNDPNNIDFQKDGNGIRIISAITEASFRGSGSLQGVNISGGTSITATIELYKNGLTTGLTKELSILVNNGVNEVEYEFKDVVVANGDKFEVYMVTSNPNGNRSIDILPDFTFEADNTNADIVARIPSRYITTQSNYDPNNTEKDTTILNQEGVEDYNRIRGFNDLSQLNDLTDAQFDGLTQKQALDLLLTSSVSFSNVRLTLAGNLPNLRTALATPYGNNTQTLEIEIRDSNFAAKFRVYDEGTSPTPNEFALINYRTDVSYNDWNIIGPKDNLLFTGAFAIPTTTTPLSVGSIPSSYSKIRILVGRNTIATSQWIEIDASTSSSSNALDIISLYINSARVIDHKANIWLDNNTLMVSTATKIDINSGSSPIISGESALKIFKIEGVI